MASFRDVSLAARGCHTRQLTGEGELARGLVHVGGPQNFEGLALSFGHHEKLLIAKKYTQMTESTTRSSRAVSMPQSRSSASG
jgi:guanyl-specific ribonuclease Sa